MWTQISLWPPCCRSLEIWQAQSWKQDFLPVVENYCYVLTLLYSEESNFGGVTEAVLPKIICNLQCIKLCWFSNRASLMPAASLTCTASAYRARAYYGPRCKSQTRNQPVICSARLTRAGLEQSRAGRLAIDLTLTPSTAFEFRKHPDMNFATWNSSSFKI